MLFLSLLTESISKVNLATAPEKGKIKCNEAIYTFVAVDQLGNPIEIPELIPETKKEKERYDGALRRRQLSLILSGRMKADDASELKALFTKN